MVKQLDGVWHRSLVLTHNQMALCENTILHVIYDESYYVTQAVQNDHLFQLM